MTAPNTPPEHIQSFQEQKEGIKADLKALREQVEETRKAAEAPQVAPGGIPETPEAKQARLEKVKNLTKELKKKVADKVAEWKAILDTGEHNKDLIVKIEDFAVDAISKIDAALNPPAGFDVPDQLAHARDRLNDLHAKVGAEEKEDPADPETLSEAVTDAKAEPIAFMPREQLKTEVEKAARKGGGFAETISNLMIVLRRFMNMFNFMASDSEQEQAAKELATMEDKHEIAFGREKIRAQFNQQIVKLGYGKLLVRPDGKDQLATVEFVKQYRVELNNDDSLTREQFIENLLKRYVDQKQIVKKADIQSTEHQTTMYRVLHSMEAAKA